MKLALAANGEGFGHAARLVSIVPRLQRWHQVEVFCPSSIVDYLKSRIPGIIIHEIPGFYFSKNGDSIRYMATLWNNLGTLFGLPAQALGLAAKLRSGGFDGVISDFEPHLAWAGRLAGLRVVQFNHPGILLKHGRRGLGDLASKMVTLYMEGPWTARMHCSFFRGEIGPVIRASLEDQEVIQGEHILVSLPGATGDRVEEALERARYHIPGLQWVRFPDPHGDFDAALRTAKAVICAGGHQTISEALFLGKPILSIPQVKQSEQEMNARFLVSSGRGMSCSLDSIDQGVKDFVREIPNLATRAHQSPPPGFTFKNDTDNAVLLMTRALLPPRERKQPVKTLGPRDFGFDFDTWQAPDTWPGNVGRPIQVTVLGSGYVGLMTSVGLAELGHQCTGVDIDHNKVGMLQGGFCPIHEPGLPELLSQNLHSGRLAFTTDLAQAIAQADIAYLCVGTPPKADGSADLSAIEGLTRSIGHYLAMGPRRSDPLVVIVKSTVPPGTNRLVHKNLSQSAGSRPNRGFVVLSNPEFLREGLAVKDFFAPSRTVFGSEPEAANQDHTRYEATHKAVELAKSLYQTLGSPIITTGWESAELAKYAANTFLATKLSFVNEMANLAEALGADIKEVTKVMAQDPRIGKEFLEPGPGYGGSCFPKDNQALLNIAARVNIPVGVIAAAHQANETQKELVFHRVLDLLESNSNAIRGSVAVLGLAFKAETDDTRESPALDLVLRLTKMGIKVRAHDPQAMDHAKANLGPIKLLSYHKTWEDAVKNASLVVIMTPWEEYRSISTQKLGSLMEGTVVLDTRRVLGQGSFVDPQGLEIIIPGSKRQDQRISIIR